MGAERSPNYHVRIFNSILATKGNYVEYEINPNSVISISTDKNIDNPAGSWMIEFNYKDGGFGNDDWFMKIEPMDYVEIFLNDGIDRYVKDSVAFNRAGDTTSYHGMGVYDIIDTTSAACWLDDSRIFFMEDFASRKLRNPTPLSITQKIATEDLVLCGFVDNIENKFSVSASGPNNRIVLSGRCAGKFLQEHYLFFNYLDMTYFQKLTQTMMATPTLTAAKVLEYILTQYVEMPMSGGAAITSPDEKGADSYTGYESDIASVKIYGKRAIDSGKDIVEVYRKDPTIPNLSKCYWAVAGKKYGKANKTVWWSRVEDSTPRTLRSIAQISQGPVWSALQTNVALEQNELWIDETGNIVLRKLMDAWTQPDYNPLTGNTYNLGSTVNILTALRSNITWNDRPHIKINCGDILSWNLKKSDANLKTLVTIHSLTNILLSQKTLLGHTGQAPLTEDTLNFVVNLFKDTNVNAEELRKLQENHIKSISTYNLTSKGAIQRFWNKFGVRPISIGDQYSLTATEFIESALTMLEKYANLWFTGSIVVKGSSKYKLGRMLQIEDLGMTFYITGVSHRFIWGESWTTTLTITRGTISGSWLDTNIEALDTDNVSIDSNILTNMLTNMAT